MFTYIGLFNSLMCMLLVALMCMLLIASIIINYCGGLAISEIGC